MQLASGDIKAAIELGCRSISEIATMIGVDADALGEALFEQACERIRARIAAGGFDTPASEFTGAGNVREEKRGYTVHAERRAAPHAEPLTPVARAQVRAMRARWDADIERGYPSASGSEPEPSPAPPLPPVEAPAPHSALEELEARHARAGRSWRRTLRSEARRLAAALGVPVPAWASRAA